MPSSSTAAVWFWTTCCRACASCDLKFIWMYLSSCGETGGRVMGRSGEKAPALSYVSTKDIEQPGETSLPCQAAITSCLDCSSSFLPGFSASTLVPLCLVHPPLSSQRDPVKLSQITFFLRSNLPRVPALLTGKASLLCLQLAV